MAMPIWIASDEALPPVGVLAMRQGVLDGITGWIIITDEEGDDAQVDTVWAMTVDDGVVGQRIECRDLSAQPEWAKEARGL